MELRVLTRGNAFALDARLHTTDLAHVVIGHGLPVGEFGRHLREPRAEVGVAGHEPRLGERLTLPREPPLRVVLAEAADRAGQSALVALGPQPSVDAERLSFCGGGTDLVHELRGDV